MPYRRLIRAIAGGLAALAVMLVFLIAAERIQVPAGLHVPARYNPFAHFDLAEEPGFWTRLKFRRASQDAGACRAALARAGLRFDPVPDQATGEGCGLTDAGRIQRVGEAALSSPVLLTCRTALSLAAFERHGLRAAASQHLGTQVTRIEHMGTYACRNINHATAGRRSRHATADAIDIGGFGLADGRRVRLVADWSASDGRGAFLRAARDAACRWFDGTLSPDYNALHRDHFHLDRGSWGTCR